MKAEKSKIASISHSGWEEYYRAQHGNKAWSGVPDEYLLEHLDEVLPRPGASVIDIASGDGRNTVPFLERDCNVVATDMSPTALASFRDRCVKDGTKSPVLVSGDFMSLDFIEGQFGCAVCFNSIPHFPAISAALSKMCKLLAKGGKATFNAFTSNDVAFGVGEKIGKNQFFYKNTLFTFTSESEIVEMLAPHNVRVLHSETRKWEEPDHGDYRKGKHTHEACFFVIERI